MRHSVLFRTCLSIFCVTILSPLTAQEQPAAESKNTEATEEIKRNATAFVELFNTSDAKGIAALFAEAGQMTMDGEVVAEGRQSIEQLYADFFKNNPGVEITVSIDSIKQMGPNLAIEKGCSEMATAEEPLQDSYTLVHTKQNGKWLIATADVTQCQADAGFDWKQELGFLEGNWSVKLDEWSVETTFEWAHGGNFLKRSYRVKEGRKIISAGIQVIGWDPVSERITSWDFDSQGGHGRGWWTRDEDNWLIESEGTTPSGEMLQSTNVLTVLGRDGFRWQSTNRSINGAPLPDTESIRVHRAKSSTEANSETHQP